MAMGGEDHLVEMLPFRAMGLDLHAAALAQLGDQFFGILTAGKAADLHHPAHQRIRWLGHAFGAAGLQVHDPRLAALDLLAQLDRLPGVRETLSRWGLLKSEGSPTQCSRMVRLIS